MRARNLKPGFFRNADLVEMPFAVRLLFAGLWTLADREGRLQDRPKQIKIELFPGDDVDIDAGLNMLATAGMLQRYTAQGVAVIQVVNFRKHQNPHKNEAPSTLPAQPGTESAPAPSVPTTTETPPAPPSADAAPCQHSAGTMPARLTPDSLNLNPEPTTPPPAAVQAVDNSQAAAVCCVLESEGIPPPDPMNPELQAFIAKGVDVQVFREAAKTAVCQKNPRFPYVLGIVRNRMQAAAAIAATALAMPVPAAQVQPGMRVDYSRMTVPSRPGPDPELQRLEAHAQAVRPGAPAAIRAQLDRLRKGQGGAA